MESLSIYEESKDELEKIKKSLAFNSVTINLSKLDERSRLEVTTALQNVTTKRISEVMSVILGVQ